ncbi:hypothetical protein KBB96_15710 [Luteolibacter ambystomatis]|uniref:Uncharacterized protein n=1 Tax=Luteolibacter ambystomatis TaxID=2824561 RepID=A0A975IYW3_9BACT|nr:DUF6209 family protein [Luteolibacter ambystomatis]QUE50308.1 hypothetical protein KBB96_15710 [Luteolibacter ambystomatis]
MKPRQSKGRRPQITFTQDGHELVQGDLIPGPCVLRYDPLRLISADEADDDKHEIHAHLRFHPSGQTWEGTLAVPQDAPLAEMASPTGQGYMLETKFELPVGTDEIEAWFSCAHDDGQTHWDSDDNKNHWLRFALHDIIEVKATVKEPDKANPAQSKLELDIVTIPQVTAVTARHTLPSFPDRPRVEMQLVPIDGAKDGNKRWGAPPEGIPVPVAAAVAFDLVYTVGDRKFTDDNQGRWYLAD